MKKYCLIKVDPEVYRKFKEKVGKGNVKRTVEQLMLDYLRRDREEELINKVAQRIVKELTIAWNVGDFVDLINEIKYEIRELRNSISRST